jgi:dolichyl-phosphate-mannose--protein O-mannosyl transferase
MAMYLGNVGRLLPVIVIAAFIAAVVATVVASFYGVYIFFFFVPLSFGLPWSTRQLWRKKGRRQ